MIHQFCAVIEAGTIAKAAQALHMTPGALSRALKRLEQELSVKLFVPSGRNIIPTAEAMRFYSYGKEILKNINQAKESIRTSTKIKKSIRIATFEVFSTHFASLLIEKEFKNEEVTLLERTPSHIERAVLDGVADFGVTYIPSLSPDLDHLAIGEMRSGIFSNAQGKELSYAVPITELGENVSKASSLDGWPRDYPRTVKYRFELLETALDLASRGACRICCPAFLISIENERLKTSYQLREEVPPKGLRLPKLKVYLVKRKSEVETSDLKKVAKMLRLLLK